MPSSIFRNFRSARANFRPLFSLFPRHSFVFFNVTFQTWQTKNSIILLIREKKQEQPVNCAAPAQYSVTHSGLRCRHPGDTDLYGDDGAALPLPISPPGAHTDSPSSSCSSARQWTGSPAASSGAESACDNRLAVGFAHPASANGRRRAHLHRRNAIARLRTLLGSRIRACAHLLRLTRLTRNRTIRIARCLCAALRRLHRNLTLFLLVLMKANPPPPSSSTTQSR